MVKSELESDKEPVNNTDIKFIFVCKQLRGKHQGPKSKRRVKKKGKQFLDVGKMKIHTAKKSKEEEEVEKNSRVHKQKTEIMKQKQNKKLRQNNNHQATISIKNICTESTDEGDFFCCYYCFTLCLRFIFMKNSGKAFCWLQQKIIFFFEKNQSREEKNPFH